MMARRRRARRADGDNYLLSSSAIGVALGQHSINDPLDGQIFDEWVDEALFQLPGATRGLRRAEAQLARGGDFDFDALCQMDGVLQHAGTDKLSACVACAWLDRFCAASGPLQPALAAIRQALFGAIFIESETEVGASQSQAAHMQQRLSRLGVRQAGAGVRPQSSTASLKSTSRPTPHDLQSFARRPMYIDEYDPSTLRTRLQQLNPEQRLDLLSTVVERMRPQEKAKILRSIMPGLVRGTPDATGSDSASSDGPHQIVTVSTPTNGAVAAGSGFRAPRRASVVSAMHKDERQAMVQLLMSEMGANAVLEALREILHKTDNAELATDVLLSSFASLPATAKEGLLLELLHEEPLHEQELLLQKLIATLEADQRVGTLIGSITMLEKEDRRRLLSEAADTYATDDDMSDDASDDKLHGHSSHQKFTARPSPLSSVTASPSTSPSSSPPQSPLPSTFSPGRNRGAGYSDVASAPCLSKRAVKKLQNDWGKAHFDDQLEMVADFAQTSLRNTGRMNAILRRLRKDMSADEKELMTRNVLQVLDVNTESKVLADAVDRLPLEDRLEVLERILENAQLDTIFEDGKNRGLLERLLKLLRAGERRISKLRVGDIRAMQKRRSAGGFGSGHLEGGRPATETSSVATATLVQAIATVDGDIVGPAANATGDVVKHVHTGGNGSPNQEEDGDEDEDEDEDDPDVAAQHARHLPALLRKADVDEQADILAYTLGLLSQTQAGKEAAAEVLGSGLDDELRDLVIDAADAESLDSLGPLPTLESPGTTGPSGQRPSGGVWVVDINGEDAPAAGASGDAESQSDATESAQGQAVSGAERQSLSEGSSTVPGRQNRTVATQTDEDERRARLSIALTGGRSRPHVDDSSDTAGGRRRRTMMRRQSMMRRALQGKGLTDKRKGGRGRRGIMDVLVDGDMKGIGTRDPPWVLTQCMALYEAKIEHDPSLSMGEFAHDEFLRRFGLASIATRKMAEFIKSLMRHQNTNSLVALQLELIRGEPKRDALQFLLRLMSLVKEDLNSYPVFPVDSNRDKQVKWIKYDRVLKLLPVAFPHYADSELEDLRDRVKQLRVRGKLRGWNLPRHKEFHLAKTWRVHRMRLLELLLEVNASNSTRVNDTCDRAPNAVAGTRTATASVGKENKKASITSDNESQAENVKLIQSNSFVDSTALESIEEDEEEDEDEDSLGIAALCVEGSAIFESMSDDVKRAVLERVRPLKVDTCETIVCEGDPGNEMYWLLDGTLEVLVKDQKVSTLQAGDFFGERALLDASGDGDKRTATVRSISRCQLLALAREDFTEIMAQPRNIDLLKQMQSKESCYVDYLSNNTWFAGLQSKQMGSLQWDLSRLVTELSVPAFTVVCEQGTHGDCMFWVKAGQLDVLVGGKKVAELTQGESFGEIALLDDDSRLRTSSVRATTSCTLLVLQDTDFQALLVRYPDFNAELIAKQQGKVCLHEQTT